MISIRYIGLATVAFVSSLLVYFQEPVRSCCTIIDINKDSGIVVIRDIKSGWLKSFKPAALEFAELNVGDSVDVSIPLHQVSRVKKAARVYPLMELSIGEACCKVIEMKMDSTEGLVVARNVEGGDLRFTVPDSLARKLVPGNDVFTSPTHGFAMFVAAGADSTKKLVYGFPLLQNVQDSLQ